MANKVSVKHVQIDKSQSKTLAIIAVTVALVIFGLFATKSLIVKGMYQKRVLHARKDVAKTLKDNYTAAQNLVTQYKVFAGQNPNLLGAPNDGSSANNGDNAKIVLDSLPSTYDAPALASSLEKVMTGRAVSINSISVTDDPTTNTDVPENNPKAKKVDFSYSGSTNFNGSAQLMHDFERSIRPFDLESLEIIGADNNMRLTVTMSTYFQPAKSIDLTPTKEVK